MSATETGAHLKKAVVANTVNTAEKAKETTENHSCVTCDLGEGCFSTEKKGNKSNALRGIVRGDRKYPQCGLCLRETW